MMDLQTSLRTCEGCIPHFYLDSRGLVTIGVGHFVPSVDIAIHMPLLRPDGSYADADEIQQDYTTIEKSEPNRLPGYYAAIADLRMQDAAITELLQTDINVITRILAARLFMWDTYPAAARQALQMMAFAIGPGRLIGTFPKLMYACGTKDWQTCAAECARVGVQPLRNRLTRDLFLSLEVKSA